MKTTRRTIYAAMGLTVLALVGGFSLASLSLGGSANSSHQGSHTTNVSPVPGVNWTQTELSVSQTNSLNSSAGCATSPGCNVSSTSETLCAGSTHSGAWCASGDYIEQVVLTTTYHVSMGGVANFTLFVETSTQGYMGTSFYFSDSATNSIETITLDFDVGTPGTGPASVTDVSIVISV